MRFPELPDWTFDVQEVSAGVYEVNGRDRHGPSVRVTGTDYEGLLWEAHALARAMSTITGRTRVPERWRAYPCEDYFASALAEHGWWDDSGQCWYIEPASRLDEDHDAAFLSIGGPGVDGIRWGYRRGIPGVWARFPIENAFRLLASTAEVLRDGYASGRITV